MIFEKAKSIILNLAIQVKGISDYNFKFLKEWNIIAKIICW